MPGSSVRRSVAEAGGPGLLYLADVPVEPSQHGSALLFRLFEGYPAERLLIMETGVPSQPHRRLPGVRYVALPIAEHRLLNSRLHAIYSVWLTSRAPARASQAVEALGGFRPEAVVTVGHGFGWLTAAAAARALQVPLHLIVHDDWPRLSAVAPAFREWLDRRFREVYREAATRLCVSPLMADEYERRYGVRGRVMLPSRSPDCPTFAPKPARVLAGDDELTVGYGGNSGPEMLSRLRVLGESLREARARVEVFGPFTAAVRAELLAVSPAFHFNGFVPSAEMIAGLRDLADVLYVPMTFNVADRDNQTLSFPSKLTDYTATGLPLLVNGPPYSSAIRWAESFPGVAEIVDAPGPQPLTAALSRLRADPDRRARLAAESVVVGNRCFDANIARAQFYAALGACS